MWETGTLVLASPQTPLPKRSHLAYEGLSFLLCNVKAGGSGAHHGSRWNPLRSFKKILMCRSHPQRFRFNCSVT